jgi:hypothetical protein
VRSPALLRRDADGIKGRPRKTAPLRPIQAEPDAMGFCDGLSRSTSSEGLTTRRLYHNTPVINAVNHHARVTAPFRPRYQLVTAVVAIAPPRLLVRAGLRRMTMATAKTRQAMRRSIQGNCHQTCLQRSSGVCVRPRGLRTRCERQANFTSGRTSPSISNAGR